MPTWRSTIKARKDHICIVCRKPIKAGTYYLKITEQYGDGFSNMKMHDECECVIDDYFHELHDKVEAAEEDSFTEPLDFADPDEFYEDEEGFIQWGVSDGITAA